jgi:hypothetical protein
MIRIKQLRLMPAQPLVAQPHHWVYELQNTHHLWA